MRKKIRPRSRSRDLKEYASICFQRGIKLPRDKTRDPESNRLWMSVWFQRLGWEVFGEGECCRDWGTPEDTMASEDTIVSEQVRAVVGLRHGWRLGIRVLRASQCSCHWTCVVILTGSNLTSTILFARKSSQRFLWPEDLYFNSRSRNFYRLLCVRCVYFGVKSN